MKPENSHSYQSPEPGATHEPPGAKTLSPRSPAASVPAPDASVPISDRDHEINKELRRLNRALRALSACNQALAQAGSEPVLLSDICDIIVRMGAYRFTWIGYAQNDEKKTVIPVAYSGHEEGYLEQIDVRWAEDDASGRGPAGTAIRDNRICVVLNTQRDPLFAPWRDTALERGYAAVIALPLRAADRAFGVLMIYSDQVGSFEHSEMELLTEMANNLAFGITAIRSQEERKRSAAALREAEAKYRQLVEEVPAISYVAEAGVEGRFLYLSPQVQKILGYHAEDCMSDPWFWWNHLNPQDHPVAQQENTWEEDRPFRVEYRMRRQDGREVWIRDEALIYRDEKTNKRLIRGLMLDITEQKLANNALRESEERYRAFVEQSSEGIFRMEYDPPVPCSLPVLEQIRLGHERGYVAECNDAMAKIFGFSSAKELLGKPLTEFLVLQHPETRQFMERFIQSGYRITDQESQEVDALGQRKIFRNTMIGIVADNCWVRTWGISRDVTERLHLEEQLRNAQQLEAIGRLAGGVAHDFNNILSIIMGHGELLLAAGVDESTKNGLEQMRRASLRAASLTQQLLAFSRKQVLQPRVLDLNEAVADVQKMLARVIGEDIELVANLHPSLLSVKVDPGQVEQVLMNLAINARDAMPKGGKLIMETGNATIGPEEARDLDLSAGRYVVLKVSDTGQGMDSSTVPHIFEPFFTTKPIGKGTGLGLATVYGIVKQSGGGIQVESEPGHGSTFRVYLPSVREDERHKKEEGRNGEKAAGGMETILIAEDEPDLRELTRIFLEGYGYKVLTAPSAELAIQTAENFPDPIHLLLTDVIMPGMSGRQLAEKIQTGRPKTRIVYMTGYTDDMVVQHKVLEPGVQLLQKPFTKADLALKVRATLDAE
ncbi:MAG TPA: PAS domain S-box protein [Candidatus Sulfotelmatobacter sp.]|nr:PAS domain S-box protein [Candidatus Sulfotelmatobacter sp.]